MPTIVWTPRRAAMSAMLIHCLMYRCWQAATGCDVSSRVGDHSVERKLASSDGISGDECMLVCP